MGVEALINAYPGEAEVEEYPDAFLDMCLGARQELELRLAVTRQTNEPKRSRVEVKGGIMPITACRWIGRAMTEAEAALLFEGIEGTDYPYEHTSFSSRGEQPPVFEEYAAQVPAAVGRGVIDRAQQLIPDKPVINADLRGLIAQMEEISHKLGQQDELVGVIDL